MAKKVMSLLVIMIMMISFVSGVVLATEVDTEGTTVHPLIAAKKIYLDGGKYTLSENVEAISCSTNKGGAILVAMGSNLTITGGTMHGVACKGENCGKEVCGGAKVVWADGVGTIVTITDGYFYNDEINDSNPEHQDLIYSSGGANIFIEGGEFKCVTPQWTLNRRDDATGTITVTGGKFYKFNPAVAGITGSANYVGAGEVVIPEGYKVVQEGDWYSVVVDEEYQLRKVLTEGGTYTFNSNIDAVGTFTVPAGVTATIDLNGYKLSHVYAATKAHALITNNGTLIINDGKGSGVITFTDSGKGGNYGSNTIQNNGDLTVNGGTILNESSKATVNVGYCHAIDTNKKLVVNGGTIKTNEYSAIRVWCNQDDDTSVEINKGTIVNPIDMHNVDGKPNKGTLVIKDGTFETTGTNEGYTKYNVRLVNFGADYDEITMKIEGGNFKGGIAAVVQNVDLKPILSISGGTFNFDVTPYLTENKKWDSVTGVVGCAHKSLAGYPLKEATLVEEGCLPYFECNDCHKLFMDASAKTETTKEELILDKLIEIKGTEAIVSDAAVLGAIQEAEDSTVIELPVLVASSTVKEVTVPIASIEAVANEDKGLLVETSDVTVTLDSKTVDTIAEEAKDATKITIEVTKEETKILNTAQKDAVKDKKVEVVISAKILADGKEISDFKGGKVTIEIPFKPAEGLKVSDYKFVFIDDDGKVTEIPSKYFDGVMVVELEHFSEYAIVSDLEIADGMESIPGAEDSNDPTPAPAPAAPVKDNTPKTGAISVIGLVSAMAVGGIVITRKRK